MNSTCWREFNFQVKIYELYMMTGVSTWKSMSCTCWREFPGETPSHNPECLLLHGAELLRLQASLWLGRICLVSLLFPITVAWNSAELWIWIEYCKVQSILSNPSIFSHGFLELVIWIWYRYDRPPTFPKKFKKAVEKYGSILRPWHSPTAHNNHNNLIAVMTQSFPNSSSIKDVVGRSF